MPRSSLCAARFCASDLVLRSLVFRARAFCSAHPVPSSVRGTPFVPHLQVFRARAFSLGFTQYLFGASGLRPVRLTLAFWTSSRHVLVFRARALSPALPCTFRVPSFAPHDSHFVLQTWRRLRLPIPAHFGFSDPAFMTPGDPVPFTVFRAREVLPPLHPVRCHAALPPFGGAVLRW